MSTNRLTWADSLKGILIILVVLGHSIQKTIPDGCMHDHLWNYIYSFHMPAFMAISGYLNFKGMYLNDRLSTIYRRVHQLLVPFFIWSLLQVFIRPLYDLNDFTNIPLYPDGYFWFLWVLFFISAIFYFADLLACKLHIKQEIAMVAACLALAGIMVVFELRLFGFQFIAYYFLFYTLGYYIHKYSDIIVTSKNWLIAILSAIWTVMAWFWNMHELPSFLSGIPLPHTLMQYGYRFLTAAIAVYVLVALSPKVLNAETSINKLVLWFGKNSLGIYTTHLLLMPLIVNLLVSAGLSITLTIVVSFAVSITASWFVVRLIGKDKLAARLLLGKI